MSSEYEVLQALCREHFGAFARKAFGIIEPGTDFEKNWHIDCIAEHLEAVYTGDIKRCRGSIFTSGILCSQTITKKEQKTSLDGLAGSIVFGTIRRVVALMTNCLLDIMVLKVTSSA